MSTLTDFLIVHQASLGSAYTPLMTLYLFATLSPIWSAYLLICSVISLLPKERFPFLQQIALSIRLSIDALLNPSALLAYQWLLPYLLRNSAYLGYFFHQNSFSEQSITPLVYFATITAAYFIWYEFNFFLFKRIKPSIDFNKEYLMNFYSPSRLFGSAAAMIALFDFEPHISYLLWCNVYIGITIATLRYLLSLRYTLSTARF